MAKLSRLAVLATRRARDFCTRGKRMLLWIRTCVVRLTFLSIPEDPKWRLAVVLFLALFGRLSAKGGQGHPQRGATKTHSPGVILFRGVAIPAKPIGLSSNYRSNLHIISLKIPIASRFNKVAWLASRVVPGRCAATPTCPSFDFATDKETNPPMPPAR